MYNTANCYSSVDSNCTRGIHDDSKLSTEMAQEIISANTTTLEPIETVESVELNAKGRSRLDLGFSNSEDTVDDLYTMSDTASNATGNRDLWDAFFQKAKNDKKQGESSPGQRALNVRLTSPGHF